MLKLLMNEKNEEGVLDVRTSLEATDHSLWSLNIWERLWRRDQPPNCPSLTQTTYHLILPCFGVQLEFQDIFSGLCPFSSITAHVKRSLSSLPFVIPIVCFWLVSALFVLIILSTSNMKTAVWSGYTYYYAVYHIGLRLLSGIFYHLDWTEVQMLTWW